MGTIYKNNFKKQVKKRVELKKKKSDNLYVTWRGYDNSFNCSVRKKTYKICYIK